MKRAKWIDDARIALNAKRDSLLELRAAARSEEDGLAGPEPDLLDVGSTAQATEILETLSETERHELARIDAALARIQDGSYGECLECALPIAKARLEALPEAPFCISCESGHENEARPR